MTAASPSRAGTVQINPIPLRDTSSISARAAPRGKINRHETRDEILGVRRRCRNAGAVNSPKTSSRVSYRLSPLPPGKATKAQAIVFRVEGGQASRHLPVDGFEDFDGLAAQVSPSFGRLGHRFPLRDRVEGGDLREVDDASLCVVTLSYKPAICAAMAVFSPMSSRYRSARRMTSQSSPSPVTPGPEGPAGVGLRTCLDNHGDGARLQSGPMQVADDGLEQIIRNGSL